MSRRSGRTATTKRPGRESSRYEQVWSGEWEPLPKSWDLACCDCGLVHGITVRVRNGKPQIRMTVNHRATAAYRRHNPPKVSAHGSKKRARRISGRA